MPEVQEFRYPSARAGHTIYAQELRPDAPPRAVIQIVHGVAEHMGRYEEVSRFLAAHGFLVCGEDHLGHGKTVEDGSYGFFAPKGGWDLVVRDVRRLRELEGEKYPSLPYFLLGHSMGSFLTRTYLIQYPGTLDGVILSGTGQEPAPLVALGRALASPGGRPLPGGLQPPLPPQPHRRRLDLQRPGGGGRLSGRPSLPPQAHRVHVPGHDGGTAVHRQAG